MPHFLSGRTTFFQYGKAVRLSFFPILLEFGAELTNGRNITTKTRRGKGARGLANFLWPGMSAGKEGIEFLLPPDARLRTMARQNADLFGEGEEPFPDGGDELLVIPSGKIRPPDGEVEEGVS